MINSKQKTLIKNLFVIIDRIFIKVILVELCENLLVNKQLVLFKQILILFGENVDILIELKVQSAKAFLPDLNEDENVMINEFV